MAGLRSFNDSTSKRVLDLLVYQFIILSVDAVGICLQHYECDAARRAGSPAIAETCYCSISEFI